MSNDCKSLYKSNNKIDNIPVAQTSLATFENKNAPSGALVFVLRRKREQNLVTILPVFSAFKILRF
jgi:hypothetical protein